MLQMAGWIITNRTDITCCVFPYINKMHFRAKHKMGVTSEHCSFNKKNIHKNGQPHTRFNVSVYHCLTYKYLIFSGEETCCCEYIAPRVYAPRESTIRYHYCKKHESIPSDIPASTTELYISGNPITVLAANSFSNLQSLHTLVLDYNTIGTVQIDAFKDLSSIISINLTHNNLNELESGSFPNLRTLKTLRINNNKLHSLGTGIFSDLSALDSLHLEHNLLQDLSSDVFMGLSSLTTLLIEHNWLRLLRSGMFAGLSNLLILKLNNNQIRNIGPNSFEHLHKVQDLNLENNLLTELESNVFRGLLKLKFLRLTNNNLNSIEDFAFGGLPDIYEIDLTDNELTSLPHSVFDSTDFPRTQGHAFSGYEFGKIYLLGNSMVCNYTLCWMKIALNEGWLQTDDFDCADSGESWLNHRTQSTYKCDDGKC